MAPNPIYTDLARLPLIGQTPRQPLDLPMHGYGTEVTLTLFGDSGATRRPNPVRRSSKLSGLLRASESLSAQDGAPFMANTLPGDLQSASP